MNFPVTVVVGCALVLAAGGCGRSKVAQCNALIDKINATADALKKAPDPKDDATARAYAAVLKEQSTAVASTELEDVTLKGFRDSLSKALADQSSGLTAVADAPGEPKPEDLAKLDASKAVMDKLSGQVNGYCQ
jgi:hypothetical protein